MVVANQIKTKFALIEPYLDRINSDLDAILLNYCKSNNFAYSSRKKDLFSVSEKFETARFKSWDEIDDLVACTIIVPNLNKEPEVIAFIKSKFNVVDIKNKQSFELNPESFRFDATRCYCKLKSLQTQVQTIYNQYTVEIQVRTALEHAWSVATHPLTYKSDIVEWEMSRLVSKLKANIEQLDMLIIGAADIKRHIISRGFTGVDFKKSIIRTTKKLLENKIIPAEHKPKDLSRYSENVFNLFRNSSDLRGYYKQRNFKQLIEFYENSLKSLSGSFPMSISLYQIVLGLFIQNDRLKDDSKLQFLITNEMKSIFPKSSEIKKVIEL
ncbi:hypothetical protein FK220_012520 [Flavobacteriaceae bacterium TP-CH-4]|uniref:RelA/SpoT domain-containing protein n=1 Tax=Pelagihabitans pacificus TaxID=2696054 RepID=A0A967AUH2_9FLAO|nr:hypothetical protein [Pelagihabitans pacificus]NHF60172.1 hypothetical protein [Pelagihabitans pacificus]